MENNFWASLAPKIRRWISEGAAAEVEEIQCPICQLSDLDFLGLGFSPPPRLNNTAATENPTPPTPQENALILPCGHIVGENCGQKWFLLRAQELRPLTCPICRCELSSNRCPQHRTHDGLAATNIEGDGQVSSDDFAVISAVIDQFLRDFARNMEAARSCTLCTSTMTGPMMTFAAEHVTEPVIIITLPGDPAGRYIFLLDEFLGSDNVLSERFVLHLRELGLEDVARLWEEYRAARGS